MALTKSQLERLLAAIKRRYLAFTFEALGERALLPEELAELRSAGLLHPSVRHMVADPIALGRIVALLPPSARRAVTYESLLSRIADLPRTEIEERAISFATAHAGEYVRGVRDMAVRDAGAIVARAGMAADRAAKIAAAVPAEQAKTAIKEAVAEALDERKTVSELKTQLFDIIDNRTRDWQRVAHTEMNTAIQWGVHDAILDKAGPDQVVYKRPNPDACQHCKRLYLEDDGITPRVFLLSQLDESNVGRRAAAWKAVIGSTHPWCNCQLQVIPEGYDFKRTRIVTLDFEAGGRNWHRGEVVTDDAYAKLDETSRAKTGFDAVLAFTGTTARPSVAKSFSTTRVADDCHCDHD